MAQESRDAPAGEPSQRPMRGLESGGSASKPRASSGLEGRSSSSIAAAASHLPRPLPGKVSRFPRLPIPMLDLNSDPSHSPPSKRGRAAPGRERERARTPRVCFAVVVGVFSFNEERRRPPQISSLFSLLFFSFKPLMSSTSPFVFPFPPCRPQLPRTDANKKTNQNREQQTRDGLLRLCRRLCLCRRRLCRQRRRRGPRGALGRGVDGLGPRQERGVRRRGGGQAAEAKAAAAAAEEQEGGRIIRRVLLWRGGACGGSKEARRPFCRCCRCRCLRRHSSSPAPASAQEEKGADASGRSSCCSCSSCCRCFVDGPADPDAAAAAPSPARCPLGSSSNCEDTGNGGDDNTSNSGGSSSSSSSSRSFDPAFLSSPLLLDPLRLPVPAARAHLPGRGYALRRHRPLPRQEGAARLRQGRALREPQAARGVAAEGPRAVCQGFGDARLPGVARRRRKSKGRGKSCDDDGGGGGRRRGRVPFLDDDDDLWRQRRSSSRNSGGSSSSGGRCSFAVRGLLLRVRGGRVCDSGRRQGLCRCRGGQGCRRGCVMIMIMMMIFLIRQIFS